MIQDLDILPSERKFFILNVPNSNNGLKGFSEGIPMEENPTYR